MQNLAISSVQSAASTATTSPASGAVSNSKLAQSVAPTNKVSDTGQPATPAISAQAPAANVATARVNEVGQTVGTKIDITA